MPSIPETCVFCRERPPDSPEHLLGDWMDTRLPFQRPQYHHVGGPARVTRRITSKHDEKIPCVCGVCNHGWMSDLESRAAKHLTKLALRSSDPLPENAHLIVALWAVKTIMVAQYQEGGPDSPLIPPEQYMYVYQNLIPPPSTVVVLGRGRFPFPTPGLGWVPSDGVFFGGGPLNPEVGTSPTYWQGVVSKGEFFCVVLDNKPVENLLRRPRNEDGEPRPQIIWPLQTKVSQIRVRHSRPRRPR
jgi:hypothetical protein